MIRKIQLLRGTTAQNDAYTGSSGELTVDTTLNELRVHDGSTAGGHKIGNSYHPDLFDAKWADHILNDVQWLRADTFSWQSGSVYEAAYQHLVDDITPIIDQSNVQSETISGTTIYFRVASDGHKICTSDQESNVAAIYTATGVAWYYIIDIANQRFKLPRVNPDKEKLINTIKVVSDGTNPTSTSSLGTGTLSAGFNVTGYSTPGACWVGIQNSTDSYPVVWNNSGLKGDVVNSDSFYAGKKYLYFYVGEFTQTALENTAGLNASLFNGKVDLDAQNLSSTGKTYIGHLAMPSNTITTLTLPANGSTVQAPYDGYLVLRKQTSAPYQYIELVNTTGGKYTGGFCMGQQTGSYCFVTCPCSKGDVVYIGYDAAGTLDKFQFVRANGAV